MFDDLLSLRVFDSITFFEKGHKYTVDGKTAPMSVSKLIENYKPKFKSDEISKRKADQLGVSQEDVLEVWRIKNLFSTQQGTILHYYIDNFYRNRISSYEDVDKNHDSFDAEMKEKLKENLKILIGHFNNFYKDHKHLLPIRNEFVLGDIEDTKICGTLDFLVYNTLLNEYQIYDFKTNMRFDMKSKYRNKFSDPISHLEVCENDTYALQMSLYQTILEKYTTIKVGGNFAVWFYAKNDNYKIFKMADRREEAKLLLENIKTTISTSTE